MVGPKGKRLSVVHTEIAPLSSLGRMGFGVSQALAGVRASWVRPELRWLSLGTVFLHGLVCGALLFVGFWIADGVMPTPPAGDGLLDSVLRWVLGALWLALVVAFSLASVWLTLLLGGVLCGPLLDALSERTEQLILGGPGNAGSLASNPTWAQSAFAELRVQVKLALVYWPVSSSLMMVTALPVVGTIAAPVLTWSLTSTWTSLSFLGPTAARHGLGAGARLGFLWRHKSIFIGLGAPACVPLLSVLLLPVLAPGLVVGMTEVFLALAAADRVPSRLTEREKARVRERPSF